MSSSSKRSFSLLSFRAAAVKRPSNFGFQLSTVELSGVLERRLRLLLVGSLDWRLALWCLLGASGLNFRHRCCSRQRFVNITLIGNHSRKNPQVSLPFYFFQHRKHAGKFLNINAQTHDSDDCCTYTLH